MKLRWLDEENAALGHVHSDSYLEMTAQFARALVTALLLLEFGRVHALADGYRTWSAAPRAKPTSVTGLINPNNILVSIGNPLAGSGSSIYSNSVREFTPTGSFVQAIGFNYNNDPYPNTEYLRDIVVDQNGSIAGYNGTFTPFLTRYSSISRTFTHTSFGGWSTVNGALYGGIAGYQNFVYVTDMATGNANGIIRFDTLNNTAVRFADGPDFRTDFIDLNIGLDGNLYVVPYSQNEIRVYDPVTMALLRQIPLPASITSTGGITSVAVDQMGRLFVCDTHDTVYRLNSSGIVETSKSAGFFQLTDIDVDVMGRLIVGQLEGRVIVGDTTLANDFGSFLAVEDPNVIRWTIFVAFARPVPAPSPGPSGTPTPTATPSPIPTCHPVITQSIGLGVTAGNSASCSNGPPGYVHFDTSYWRAFDMPIYTSGQQYDITSVSFAVDSARSGSGMGQPVTVRLYTNTGGAFPGGTRTELAAATVTVPDTSLNAVEVPLAVSIPAGTSQLVMEIFSPSGQAAGNSFFIGSNAAAQTGPSFVSAVVCGNPTPTDTADIGFPDMHIMFFVRGSCRTGPPTEALNISTRLRVETGDNAMIGGFIVTGDAPQSLILRGIGPSLANSGISDTLADPVLALHGASGVTLYQNDNWQDDPEQSAEISAAGLALQDPSESGIAFTVSPGAYTAILTGQNQTTGVGLVEIYNTNSAPNSQLGNISTRGFVQAGSNVMIGGFILGGSTGNTRVAIRGIGPSLTGSGLSNVLADPTLELHDSNGTTLVANDNWQDDPASAAALSAYGLALQNNLESGIFIPLPPGAFTAILAGHNGGTGTGLVEVYNLQ